MFTWNLLWLNHGLIAEATGTGKTVTLKVLAEFFSDTGVPVFVADIKVNLFGMYVPGAATERALLKGNGKSVC